MGKKLLVADESPTIHKIISLTLSSEGYEIASSKDAADTLRKIDDWKPNLLILDASLGSTNGLELCKTIREKGYDEKTLPILIIHGSFDEFDVSNLKKFGAQGSLLKPFDTTQLMDVLRNLGKKEEIVKEEIVSHDYETPQGSPAFGSKQSWDWDKETDEITVTGIRSQSNILDSDETADNWELSENSQLSEKLASDEKNRKPNLVFDANDWSPENTDIDEEAHEEILEPSQVDEDKTQVFLEVSQLENSPSFELDESTPIPDSEPTGGFELPESALSDEPPSSNAKPFEPDPSNEMFSEPPEDISAQQLVDDLTRPAKDFPEDAAEEPDEITYNTPDLDFGPEDDDLEDIPAQNIINNDELPLAATPPLSPSNIATPVKANELQNLVSENLQQTLERIAWEVVPELAEKVIREEIQKILREQSSNNN